MDAAWRYHEPDIILHLNITPYLAYLPLFGLLNKLVIVVHGPICVGNA